MQQPTRLISTPFAQEGEKTEIQNVTGEFDNSATYRLGFPPLTMQSIRLGGKPPKGTDFNGVLFDITENISFLCKGGRYQYNAGLSTLIGGYPEGSNLLLDDNVTEVVSTVAGNQNNPNIDMTGWILKPNKTTAVNVADASGETQQQVNYNGGAKWHSRAGGYLENERVVLDNGDIVKSTVDGNLNDPNVDLTGWVSVSKSVHTVGSAVEMMALSSGYYNMVVVVKATGAMYQYDATQSLVDDGVYVRNGWVLIGYHDCLLATLAGLKGDGTNEHTKLKALLDVASILKKPINLCGLGIHTSNIVATGDIKLVGSGGIKLFAGSNGTLLTTAYDLIIDGDIEIDQDKVNNSGGTVSAESHCSIKHSGDNLILKGAKIKPSASINVVTRAKKKVLSQDTEVDGGMVTLYAISPNAKVEVIGGEYKNSTLYDNIQILNGGDVVVERVRSKDSKRSCIVIGNSTGKARIFGNYTSGAKTDGANQGGWGIAASVNSQDSVIGMNVCLNNQRGPMTVDTYPDSGPSVDNRISVFGNILGGKYNNAYATTGLGLNNVKHGNVTGNIIFSAAQGILAVDSDHTIVHGNTILDTLDFAFQGYLSPNITFKGNTVDGCTASGQAVIRFIDATGFRCSGNTYRNLTGAASILYRVSGNTKDWIISDDDCLKLTAGSGYVFQILGAGVTGGKIRRNNYKADGVAGWQWYIVSDNLAQFSTHDNELDSTGTNYITSGANVTAGDDTVNGSRNYWPSIPTAFKSRIGQIATIANIQKTWTGTAWVSANVVAVTYDPPSIAVGASVTTNVAVTGAVFGDFVQASFSSYDANIEITAVVSGTNQVTVKFKNIGAAPIDLGSGTLRVKVS